MGEGAVHLQQVRDEGEGAVHLQQVRGEGGWLRVQYTFSR